MRFTALLVPFLIVLSGCRSSEPARLKVDPALLMLIPADTETLGGAKLDQLRASPAYKKYGQKLEGRWVQAFEARTGLDPRRDVWEVVGALRPGEQSLFLARGKFVPDGGLEPRLGQLGAQRTSYKGYTLIGSDQAAVTFLNPSTLVAGRPNAVRGLLDIRGQIQGPPPALNSQMRAVPANSQLWIVSRTGPGRAVEQAPAQSRVNQAAQFFPGVRSYWGGFSLRDGLDLHGQVECATPEDAASLVRTAKGIIGMGRLNAPDNQPELLRFFDAIQIEQKEKLVSIDLKTSEAALEQALALVSRYSGGSGLSLPDLLR